MLRHEEGLQMTDTTTTARQEQIRSAIRKGNEFTVEKIKAVAGSVKLPGSKIDQTRFDVPKLREDALAYARKLPAPVDVVESAFGLADRLVAERRRLVGEVKKAATAALRLADGKPAETAAAPVAADEADEAEIVEDVKDGSAPKKASRKSAS
jgi:hypothetical protein